MQRQFARSLGVLATGLMISAVARADDPQPQRGYLYFPPVKSAAPATRARPVIQQQANSTAVVAVRTAPVAVYTNPAVPYGYSVPARPVSWGVRYGVAGSGYPASLFGQLTAPVGPQAAPAASQPIPAYAQANYGPGPMYQGTPNTAPVVGYSSIYGYGGRFYGPYYGYGPSYYSYGGMGGWGTPYNAGYYGSGCYTGNACCRASQRYCTPFGGMFRGCGSGCYLPTPAPCPTACAYVDPCGPMTGTPTTVPQSAAPQAYDPAMPSTPNAAPSNTAPPTPQPPDAQDPATPIEKKPTPAPQARNFPRIPGLAPDA